MQEAKAKLEGIRSSYKEEARQELEKKRRELDELTHRLRKYVDSLKRTVVRSPVSGVVKTLYVFTRGGVVKPGGTVAEVVPAGDRLVIEARLPTQDIGYVQVGQSAVIKLASSDDVRFGPLEGRVTNVSPDTLVTREGAPYYKVRIETGSDHFSRGNLTYCLFPGMQVTASIRTGQWTVLRYLLDPILFSLDDALG